MSKTVVLDTNVLLHDPGALFAFGAKRVIIPFAVIEEIDNQKKRQDEIGRNAREISRVLDGLRSSGRLAEGVSLGPEGLLRIELNHQEIISGPPGLELDKYDNRILAVAYNLGIRENTEVTLVTKDLNLRIKADVLGIPAEDFTNEKVDFHTLYQGYEERDVTDQEMETFYREGKLEVNGDWRALPHQFLVMRTPYNPSRSALGRYFNHAVTPLRFGDASHFGIRAKNKEQRFALELLSNDKIKVVTLVGRAGTGKTLLALAVGLDKVLEQNQYSRLLVTRPVVPMGSDLGYLPGAKEEKLRPWMQPIFDNLEFLLANCEEPHLTMEYLMDMGTLELEALTYIRGRSIPNQYILCDEAQNLTPHMIKTLITRVGDGAKIVFTGDPEQIDNPYLDASSNGLTCLIESIKNEEIAGHVTLYKGERSEVAELGAKIF